jgi:protease I
MKNKKRILIPLPSFDFDPTEVAVTWDTLHEHEHEITFATPDGEVSKVDMIMINGENLGIFSSFLVADKNGKRAYDKLECSTSFNKPISYQEINCSDFDALFLPGGHAQGMKTYLESKILQDVVVDFFEKSKPVAAICHGVLLVARSVSNVTGKSVLFGRKTTALLKSSENLAWTLTRKRLQTYYKTYPETTVEEEVKSYLEKDNDFISGPFIFLRDSPKNLKRGFFVVDGNYISARWPGDVHAFSAQFNEIVGNS